MYWKIALGVAIGASIGGLMGYFGSCSTGTCPLTATWWRGALVGAVMGFAFTAGTTPTT